MDATESDRLVEAWWDRWWAADYSWEGLRRRRWRGWSVTRDGALIRSEKAPPDAKRATLQDFWRAEEDRLISDPTNPTRWFTSAHAPVRWKDKEPEKATWSGSRFEDIRTAILTAIGRLPADAFDLTDPSVPRAKAKTSGSSDYTRLVAIWPIPLHGVVVDELPSIVFDHDMVVARQAAILEAIDFMANDKPLDFADALFCSDINVMGENLDLRLRRALVVGNVDASSKPLYRVAATNANFVGSVDFTSTSALDRSSFGSTNFHEDATFDSASFKTLVLSAAVFHGRADFDDMAASRVHGQSTTFKGPFSAKNASLAGVDFERATFDDHASFEDTGLDGKAFFVRTTWNGRALFTGLRAYDVNFSEAVFNGQATFQNATFKTKANFASVQFEQAARFDEMGWPSDAKAVGQAFREARFKGFASFEDDNFWAYAAFDGAKLDAEVRMSRASFSGDRGLARAIEAATEPRLLEQLEHGLRTLKLSAESIRDRELEQKYYAYQLQVRRKGPMSLDQRGALAVYAQVSRYGSSLWLPIIWLVGLWLACSTVFLITAVISHDPTTAGIGLPPGPMHPAVWEAAEMSARGIFSLLGTWSLRPPSDLQNLPDMEAALLWRHAGIGFFVRAVWSIEAVFAGVLVFLSALSVRRWFQIN